MKCNYCGRDEANILCLRDEVCYFMCDQCAQYCNTCGLCNQVRYCEFETNPSPIPKQVQQTIRQGNMVVQTIVKNPERIQAFCVPCQCWNSENQCCGREFGTCGRYDEYVPETPNEPVP